MANMKKNMKLTGAKSKSFGPNKRAGVSRPKTRTAAQRSTTKGGTRRSGF